MEETSNVPKLRFKYGDTWQSSKLHFLADIKTGNKDLKDNVKGGKYPFFVRSNHVERINSYSFDGEAILIPGDGNVGQIYHYIIGKFDFHQRVYKISDFDSNIMGKYIYYYFQKNFLKEALRNSVKATVDSLRLPTIKNFIINYPSIKEQEKIVKMLNNIEKKINLLYKQQDALNDFKKFCLQNLFEGKLRFKEFIDDWIKIKLGNLVKIYSGKSPKNLIKDKGKFPYFKVEQLNDCSKFLKITPYLINDSSLLIKKGSVIFPKRGMAIMSNKIRILNQNSFMDTNLMALTVNEKMMNNEFLFYLLINERLSRIADTTSIPQLNNKHINPYLIYLPSLKEQEKIANFLSSIDKKIDLTQNQIDLMENFKKGLLQEMFV